MGLVARAAPSLQVFSVGLTVSLASGLVVVLAGLRDSLAGFAAHATDLGHVPGALVEMLRDADAALVESNHCTELLAGGSYPPHLKRRVGARSVDPFTRPAR